MRPGVTQATFSLRGFSGLQDITVVDENIKLVSDNGNFTDTFEEYAVHVYKVATPLHSDGSILQLIIPVLAGLKKQQFWFRYLRHMATNRIRVEFGA